MLQWQEYVDERVRRMQAEYENVFLVGHSMGSLLALQTAVSTRKKSGAAYDRHALVIRVSPQYFKII
jgi:alpha-beta hydrolase superfamily lysophospholipase